MPRGLNNTYIGIRAQIGDRNTEHLGVIIESLKWIVSILVPLTLG